jgi:hypothetical protein
MATSKATEHYRKVSKRNTVFYKHLKIFCSFQINLTIAALAVTAEMPLVAV